MQNRGTGRVGRALRHGVALGLALTAAWGVSLTADFGGVEDQLAALGELPGEGQTLAGWGRLLLKGSPLLRLGEDAVLKLNTQPDNGGGPEPEPPDPEEEDVEQPDLQPSDSGEGIVEMTGRGKEGSRKRGTSLMISGDGAYPARPGEGKSSSKKLPPFY